MLFARETDNTPAKYYGACSITYLGAMLASNQALQYVSYPTQVDTLCITVCQLFYGGKHFAHYNTSVILQR